MNTQSNHKSVMQDTQLGSYYWCHGATETEALEQLPSKSEAVLNIQYDAEQSRTRMTYDDRRFAEIAEDVGKAMKLITALKQPIPEYAAVLADYYSKGEHDARVIVYRKTPLK